MIDSTWKLQSVLFLVIQIDDIVPSIAHPRVIFRQPQKKMRFELSKVLRKFRKATPLA
jgi:hypothetical protein